MAIDSLSAHQAAWLSDQLETQAFVDLYAAAPVELKTRLGLQVKRVADATLLMATNIPSPMFNRVIGLGMMQACDPGTINQLIDIYRQAGIGSWWLHWNPLASPSHTPQLLQSMGFTQPARHSWAKVLRGAEPAVLNESDLVIAPADDANIAQIAAVIAQVFEMPAFMADWLQQLHGRPCWRTYAVLDGSQVVGGGCLFIDGDGAWLGMGAVLPSHRRRGGQGLLMRQRINDAIAAGCSHIATETGEAITDEPNQSLRNMAHCGFETVASRMNFAAPV